MGVAMAGIAWLIIIVMLTGFFNGWLDHQANPNQRIATAVNDDGRKEIVLQRNRMGHYVARGHINGVPVTFLLDTGATGVALSPELAKAAGVKPGRPIMTRTANGPARGYLATLDSVKLGGIEQFNVHATISPGLGSGDVLLGMSFLKNLELIQRDNRLLVRQ